MLNTLTIFAEETPVHDPLTGVNLLGAIVFAAIGVAVFLLVFWIIVKVTPFSLRKEIEEDQNVSLAIIIGSVMIGIAIIIAAAIHGG